MKTNKIISKLGFGAWPLGNTAHGEKMTEEEGVNLVQKAYEEGIRFFDTAPNYALGASETILGKALKGKRDDVFINSKFGHHPDNTIDFNENKIAESIKGSLKRLQTTYLDSLILHNPPMEVLKGETPHFETLKQLKKEGLISNYGVSVDTKPELDAVLNYQNVDVIEVLFNIFSQEARHYFNEIKNQNIILIIKVPLDSGWLTGKYNTRSTFTDIKSRWTKEDKERRTDLLQLLSKVVKEPVGVKHALSYILSYDAVTTVIPGIRTEQQLAQHLAASKQKLSDKDKQKIEQFYETHIKDNPLPW